MIEVKRDPYIFLFYAVVVAAVTILLYQHVITWEEVKGLIAGVLMPSVFGLKRSQPDEVKTVTAKNSAPPKEEKKDENEDKDEKKEIDTPVVITTKKED